jgi:HAMP domain-containing protein
MALAATSRLSGLFTIRSYLLLMIVTIIVPMMLLVAILAWDYGAAGRRTIEAERLDAANNLMHLMDREVQATTGFLNGLATSLAQRPSDPRFAENVVASARANGFAALAVHDRAGRLLFLSPATVGASVVSAHALGVSDVFASSKVFVSDFVAGGETLKPGLFFVSVPVLVDGQVSLVLSGGVPVQRLQPLLAEAGLREGWLAGIIDRQGILLARRVRPEHYVGGPAQQPMVEIVRSGRSAGLFDVAARDDGVEVKNAFRRSAISGWTAVVAVPASVINAPLYRSALGMVAIGLALTLLSLFLGALVARRISRAVQQLGVASAAFASGYPAPLPTSMLTELQDVATAMRVSAQRAKRREAMSREVPPDATPG